MTSTRRPAPRVRRSATVVLPVLLALAALVALVGVAALTGLGPFAPSGSAERSSTGRPAADERSSVPAGEELPADETTGRPRASGTGADVSWPQCRRDEGIAGKRGQGKPMPPRRSRFVVLGLTNGPAFHPNPCLARQVDWVERHRMYAAAYAVTTYPFPRELRRHGADGPFGADTLGGRLANVGYQQARFNLRTMAAAGLTSPVVWIDVEDSSLRVWPRTPQRNRAVVRGLLRGYREAELLVGFYSTPYVWGQILGDARYGLPEWRSAGETSRAAARARCTTGSIQGGPAVLAQWWTTAMDFDLTCPGFGSPAAMATWFHRY